jgi:cytochrome o ubiquinol oxidase operon protein cyoD
VLIARATGRPGVEHQESTANFLSYTMGLGLAVLLTIASFVVAQTNLLWPPGIPVGLIVLAFAQIGVHLVFFCISVLGPITRIMSSPSRLAC